MSQGKIEELRRACHNRICEKVLRKSGTGIPNNADSGNSTSVKISKGIVDSIGIDVNEGKLPGQTVGSQFEMATVDFLQNAFELLLHLRPGEWEFSFLANGRFVAIARKTHVQKD